VNVKDAREILTPPRPWNTSEGVSLHSWAQGFRRVLKKQIEISRGDRYGAPAVSKSHQGPMDPRRLHCRLSQDFSNHAPYGALAMGLAVHPSLEHAQHYVVFLV